MGSVPGQWGGGAGGCAAVALSAMPGAAKTARKSTAERQLRNDLPFQTELRRKGSAGSIVMIHPRRRAEFELMRDRRGQLGEGRVHVLRTLRIELPSIKISPRVA